MLANLLVLIDGSPAATAALNYAAVLAKRLKARLNALHVDDQRLFQATVPIGAFGAALAGVELMPVPLTGAELKQVEQQVAEANAKLHADFRRVQAVADAQGEFVVMRGDVLAVMQSALPTADVVVMGCRQSESAKERTNPGTRIEPLLRTSTRPVILVPQGGAQAPTKILLPYDRSDGAQRAMRECAGLAHAFNAEVEVFCIETDDVKITAAHAQARAYFSGWPLHVSYHHAKGNPKQGIVDRAKASGATLVAMGAFGQNRLREMLFGSATLYMLEHLPCAVLLVR